VPLVSKVKQHKMAYSYEGESKLVKGVN